MLTFLTTPDCGAQAYGKTTYLITTLEKCPRGTEGAVSLEGTLAGFLAALGYGLVAYLLGQVRVSIVSCTSNFQGGFNVCFDTVFCLNCHP